LLIVFSRYWDLLISWQELKDSNQARVPSEKALRILGFRRPSGLIPSAGSADYVDG
jgi:hypothetical protein